YIFKDQQDYLQYSRKLFNESPTTPYGYYRSDDSVVVVNGATGNGTLVHEMVHALIDSDFPQMPTWFNEGLAALFEESRVEVGKIVGMNNWRYPIFKQAIAAKSFVNLEELMKKSNEEFYDDRDGFNYAESRYFCYYLQQRGLLIPFYKRFRENIEKDPHGIETLKEVLGKELEEVEADWLEWATVSVYQKR
ncbi:MAG: hypothetical protein JNN15_11420, partial [Blastocatellia bacterium]|nr:hypothetical protein [Blastocatellia bacterium]